MALRFEVSYQPDRVFNTRTDDDLETRRLDQWRAAAGVDLDGPFGVFVNVQYLYDRVMDAPDDLIRPDLDRVVTVFARRRFAYDTLSVELRWYGELEPDNGMARGSVAYELGSNTTLSLSGVHFYGTNDGIFGEFQKRDRLVLTLSHAF
jgi:hypothetical protein